LLLLAQRTTPTLMNSSRSTRGTMRITAYSYKCLSCILCVFYKVSSVRKPRCQKIGVYLSLPCRIFRFSGRVQPLVRQSCHYLCNGGRSNLLFHICICLVHLCSKGQQHMVF